MIPIDQLVKGNIYRLNSRNLSHGYWDGKDGFIGIRTKFGNRFLDHETHWDLNSRYGTAKPLEIIGEIPAGMELNIWGDTFEYDKIFAELEKYAV
jgi:hypothetical protein